MAYIDMHCHILPGLDDGSQSMEETLEMLEIAQAEGVDTIICTPHFKSPRRSAPEEKILATLESVQAAAEQAGIDIQLYPGNEIYYTAEMEEALEEHLAIAMNGSEYVLVEFSPMDAETYIRNAVNDILGMGYTPIIAHVERYQSAVKNPALVEWMRANGCLIQVNAASICGELGFGIKRFVHKLLKKEWVDFVGTDAHGPMDRAPRLRKCADILYRKYDSAYADAILGDNAAELLHG